MKRERWPFLVLLFGAVFFYLGCFSTTQRSGSSETPPREVLLFYAFTVKGIPAGSSKVNIWVPLPTSDSHQKLKDFKVICPYPHTLYTEPEYGNRILKVETAGDVPENIRVTLEFAVSRTAWEKKEGEGFNPAALDGRGLKRYLSADRLVPIDGRIAEETRKVVRGNMTPLQEARAIYDFVVKTMKYDKTGEGWGRGDALYACDVRKGNCTDFHSLFIGMARACGIPARFVMGLPVPTGLTEGKIPGYHCWAEFYLVSEGWIPVDASEASKHPEMKEYYFGNLDENRVAFSVGRDIRLDPALAPVNYLIYPSVLIDGKLHSEVDCEFRFVEGFIPSAAEGLNSRYSGNPE